MNVRQILSVLPLILYFNCSVYVCKKKNIKLLIHGLEVFEVYKYQQPYFITKQLNCLKTAIWTEGLAWKWAKAPQNNQKTWTVKIVHKKKKK